MPKAYLIGVMTISDLETYAKYKEKSPDVLKKYGGNFLSRGGDVLVFEGNMKGRVVVAEFPSLEKAEQFYHSDEYTELRLIRQDAAVMNLFAVSGYESR